jgi:hypothetical protein
MTDPRGRSDPIVSACHTGDTNHSAVYFISFSVKPYTSLTYKCSKGIPHALWHMKSSGGSIHKNLLATIRKDFNLKPSQNAGLDRWFQLSHVENVERGIGF